MKFIFLYADCQSWSRDHILPLLQEKLSNEYDIYANMFEFIEFNSSQHKEILPYIPQYKNVTLNWFLQKDEDNHLELIFCKNCELSDYYKNCIEKIDEILETRIPVLK